MSILDINDRLALLKNLPLFAHVDESYLKELADLFHDVGFAAQQILVQENEAVDSVYILVEGQAEVSRQVVNHKKITNEVLAVLHSGEAVGISETGFFSKLGIRSATIKAITPVSTIRLDLSDFKQFLHKHAKFIPTLEEATDIIVRQNFIKHVEPFSEVSPVVLQKLIKNIDEIEVPANHILIQQGDSASCCYLLCSGKAEVIFKRADGSTEQLAELTENALFGELGLFTGSRRNATVLTTTPCKLLVLKREEFRQLLMQSPKASVSLTSMLMDRHRPLQTENITVHTRLDAAKQTVVILKNGELGSYFKLSDEGLFAWKLMDGEHSVQDIAIAYFYQFKKLAIDDIGYLILNLMNAGFVQKPVLALYVDQTKLSILKRFIASFKKLLHVEYSFNHVDLWVTKAHKQWGYLFFTKAAKILMALIAIIGFCVFVKLLTPIQIIIRHTPYAWLLLALMGPAVFFIVPFHELAHALTTKAYGNQVNRMGIGWFIMGPVAFVDTSDMWLNTRGRRIVVNLAGIYVNIIISGLLALFALLTYHFLQPVVTAFLWLVALASYLSAFRNMNPMFELDGYYALMDAVDRPNLRIHAIDWLLSDFKKTLVNRSLIRKYFPEILYWVVSIVFVIFSAYFGYIIQTYVLNSMLPQKVGHFDPSHYKWVVSVAVVLFSFFILYARVRQQAKSKIG